MATFCYCLVGRPAADWIRSWAEIAPFEPDPVHTGVGTLLHGRLVTARVRGPRPPHLADGGGFFYCVHRVLPSLPVGEYEQPNIVW